MIGNSRGFTDSSATMVLTRPYLGIFSAGSVPQVQVITLPGLTAGSVQTSSGSELQGSETNFLLNLCGSRGNCTKESCALDCSGYRLDLIAGFRYLQLNENMNVSEEVVFLPGLITNLAGVGVYDHFATRNDFYGGQFGLRAEWWEGNFFMNAKGVIGIGDTQQEVPGEWNDHLLQHERHDEHSSGRSVGAAYQHRQQDP